MDSRASKLILDLYDAVLSPELLPPTILRIADSLGSAGAWVYALSRNPAKPYASTNYVRFPEEAVETYLDHMWQHDLGLQHAQASAGAFYQTYDFLSESETGLDPFVDWNVKATGFKYLLGQNGCIGDDISAGVAFFRTPKQGPVDNAARILFGQIWPHMAKSLTLARAYRSAMNAGDAVIESDDLSALAVIRLRPDGVVINLNTAARDICSDGRLLRLTDSTVACVSKRDNDRLKAAIRSTATLLQGRVAAPTRAVILYGHDGRRRYVCRLHPQCISSSTSGLEPIRSILMTIHDSASDPQIDTEALRSLFGLSPREVELAVYLAMGNDLPLVAEDMKLSVGTVRQHLKSIFRKTMTSRQAELVAMLWRDFARLTVR